MILGKQTKKMHLRTDHMSTFAVLEDIKMQDVFLITEVGLVMTKWQ